MLTPVIVARGLQIVSTAGAESINFIAESTRDPQGGGEQTECAA